MIFLFDDFGSADLYVGQVKSRLHAAAAGVPIVDLLHDAANFDVVSAAHLLAALSAQLPCGAVVQAVVDPGVGGPRRPVAMRADDRWYVGPDNGLLAVVAARAAHCVCHEITWRPPQLSATFHGRDLFAPVTARLAAGGKGDDMLTACAGLNVTQAAGDLARIIYVDHYGNAMSGLRGAAVAGARHLRVAGRRLLPVRIFDEAMPDEPFWYVNSLGLVEIAVRQGSAADRLGLLPGTVVTLE